MTGFSRSLWWPHIPNARLSRSNMINAPSTTAGLLSLLMSIPEAWCHPQALLPLSSPHSKGFSIAAGMRVANEAMRISSALLDLWKPHRPECPVNKWKGTRNKSLAPTLLVSSQGLSWHGITCKHSAWALLGQAIHSTCYQVTGQCVTRSWMNSPFFFASLPLSSNPLHWCFGNQAAQKHLFSALLAWLR